MVNTSEVLLICYFMSTVELVKSRIQCVIEFNAEFFYFKNDCNDSSYWHISFYSAV